MGIHCKFNFQRKQRHRNKLFSWHENSYNSRVDWKCKFKFVFAGKSNSTVNQANFLCALICRRADVTLVKPIFTDTCDLTREVVVIIVAVTKLIIHLKRSPVICNTKRHRRIVSTRPQNFQKLTCMSWCLEHSTKLVVS